MYWNKTHEQAVSGKRIGGSGQNSLAGHARDFQALLEASEPHIQNGELIVGCCLAAPESAESINLGYYNTHYPPGHETILRMGLTGIRDRAGEALFAETDSERRDFLRAVEISYDAACRYVKKYAELADIIAAEESDPLRKADLKRISSVCAELAGGKPSSFHAALQLFQFSRMFGAAGSIGRFDQWMYPFYKSDIERGVLTAEEAQELLECLWIKINHFGGYNDTLRNMALAGQTSTGEDACNELTYMCLEASETLRLPEPKLNVRFFDGTPRKLLLECCRLLAAGINVIAIYNDEVAVPGLSRLGIPIEDAREYCNDGCSELVIGGKSTLTFKSNYSLEPLRETVLNAEHHQYGTFDDVMADFKSRLIRYIPDEPGVIEGVTFPYFAASIDDCLDKASPMGARYQIKGTIMAQIGNSADGLAAIKKLIYDDRSLTWLELVSAIKADYEGYEPLRQKILNSVPKYGNDDDYVDVIAKEIAEYFCDYAEERYCNSGGSQEKLAAGLMCFGIHHRKEQLATPDGRRQGDLTASSFSPSIGMDKSGPTAVLKSVAKVDLTKAGNGSVLDMALHTSTVQGEAAFRKFISLVKSFLKLRCTATLQLNVIDRDTLLKARADPDNPEYKTLIVRVWGFSAVFVELHPDLQDHVIARTEHAL